MKIVVASDTFGVLPLIEQDCNIFIHCGNFCPVIDKCESLEKQVSWLDDMFIPWLKNIPAKHKILMPGNNDLAVEYLEPNFQYHIDAIFLKDQSTTIDKTVIYGTPWTPFVSKKTRKDMSLYFSRSEKIYDSILSKIPDETNILLTRSAPYGILDKTNEESLGDKKLLNRIEKLPNLKMHLFNFISDEGGQHTIKNKTLFANASVGQPGYIEVELN